LRSTGPMKWSTGNSYQAEALTNVLRHHTCRSSHSEDRKLPNHYGSIFVHFRSPGKLDIHVLYLKIFVHVSALYIYTVRLSIRPLIGVNNVKPMSGRCFLLLTCSTGPMEWSTGNSYQAEALTNVLRYHTYRSSHPEDRKLPITELKWDARTVTNIVWHTCIIPQNVCTCLYFINIYSKTVYTPLDWRK
jgi:hypothetical protein